MKHNLLLLPALCLLVACGKPSPFQKVMTGDPIKPVMFLPADAAPDYADYIPTLLGEKFDSVCLDSALLTFFQNGNEINIPVIDNRPHKQSLFLAAADDESIVIAFSEPVHDLTIRMFWQNMLMPLDGIQIAEDGEHFILPMPKQVKKNGRSFIRVYAADRDYNYNDLLVPLHNMKPVADPALLTRHDQQAQVLYSLMVDRFCNANKQNDWKINSEEVFDIVDYQGGDLAGITRQINAGFFEQLGINTIWISPITQNPWDAWGYYPFDFMPDQSEDELPLFNNKYDRHRDHTRFSAYHGYWPTFVTKVDSRLGTDKELEQLLATAHKHNLNVILDYVANHVHIESAVLKEHPDWVTDSLLPDGRRNFELWDEARLTTWFDKHIPTLDLEREEVYQPMTDSAIYWLQHFDLDGFRHDACKHIPECYWRTLTQKMKQQFPDRPLWMIGETYGSPELIGSYVKTGMLDAQFDFNVYFTAIHAIAEKNGDMREVERVIEESLAAYGAHHTMGNISGNHDQVRFISLAGGDVSFAEDGKQAGWTRNVTVGDTAVAYKKAMLLHVLNLTIPGVPCIYQGDEFGEPGGNDPDNRKMMRFEGLNPQEEQMRNQVAGLIHLRRSSLPLLYGEYLPVYADKDVLCFRRVYMGNEVLVAINKSGKEVKIEPEEGRFSITLKPYEYIVEQQ
ncbi:MAG: hypothetical protein IJ776_07345 [Paludibacteraceae bacterium]|nr:hypothetical protein [Paludibacteraceae bacterium]